VPVEPERRNGNKMFYIPVFTYCDASLVCGNVRGSHQSILFICWEFDLHNVGLGGDNSRD
jgi:hypothetical protein